MGTRDLMTAPEQFASVIHKWGERWGVPDLHEIVTVEFSSRMTVSLGRYQPATGRVRLASRLLDDAPDLLEETLCHEVAHVAVHRLHGAEAKPHGESWAELVSAWSGGNGTYGLRVGRENRDRYFDRRWDEIQLEIDDKNHRLRITAGFWNQCPEIRSPVVRTWLRRHRTLEWPRGRPPKMELVHLGENRFMLLP